MSFTANIVPRLLLISLLAVSSGYTQPLESPAVYTWIDAAGNTHYGDRPPDDVPIRQLDATALQPSVIGGSALRGSERDLLQQLRAEQQSREQRRAEQAALQKQAPEVTIINNIPARKDRRRYGGPYYPSYYAYPHRYRYEPKRHGAIDLGINLDLDLGGVTPKGKRPRPLLNRTQRPKPAGSKTPRALTRRPLTQPR